MLKEFQLAGTLKVLDLRFVKSPGIRDAAVDLFIGQHAVSVSRFFKESNLTSRLAELSGSAET